MPASRRRWPSGRPGPAPIEAAAYQDIQADPSLMQIVRETGGTLFGDNCAVCHGVDAKADLAFPT